MESSLPYDYNKKINFKLEVSLNIMAYDENAKNNIKNKM